MKEDLVSMVAEINTVNLVTRRSVVKLLNTAALVAKVTMAIIGILYDW